MPLAEIIRYMIRLGIAKTPIKITAVQLLIDGPIYMLGKLTPYNWCESWLKANIKNYKTHKGFAYLTDLGGKRCLNGLWANIYMEPPEGPSALLALDIEIHKGANLAAAELGEFYQHIPDGVVNRFMLSLGSKLLHVDGNWSDVYWKPGRAPKQQQQLYVDTIEGSRKAKATYHTRERKVARNHVTQSKLLDMSLVQPEELIRLVDTDALNDASLTYAAEFLGNVSEDYYEKAIILLKKLICHESIVVREGAVSGLISLSDEVPEIQDYLTTIAADKNQHKVIRGLCQKP